MTRAWVALTIAGLCEIVWAVGLKYTQGFTVPVPSAITVTAMLASLWFLSQALRLIPVGTGYAVWTGIGAVGTGIVGMVALGESRAVARLVSIGLVVIGIAGLRLSTPAAP